MSVTSDELITAYHEANKATADRAAALAQMRERIALCTMDRHRCATLLCFQDDNDSFTVELWQSLIEQTAQWDRAEITYPHWPLKPAQAREFALALEVLAEIAEQWAREAKEQS